MRERLEGIASAAVIVAAVLVAVAAGRLVFAPQAPGAVGAQPGPPELLSESVWDEILQASFLVSDSRRSASVTVVEFADLECPFCRRTHLAFADVQRELSDSVAHRIVHYPIDRHRFAMPAARAAECAGSQGRIARFVDLVFEKQDSLGLKSWVSYAHDAGVQDTVSFQECNAATGPVPRVERGRALGRQIGVQSTPTVVVNGWRLGLPPRDAEELIQVIRQVVAGEEPYAR